ncbi:MAG: hypothetical protein M0Z50_04705 [Planctomycetia bacterium]|nr:hypothetical protein [Planctomycetia bacterium]
MGQPSIVGGDFYWTGSHTFKTLNLPSGAVEPDDIAPGEPGNYIDPTTMRQRHKTVYAQDSTTAATTETRAVYTVVGQTAAAVAAQAALIAPCTGNATVTVDFQIAGTSILNAPITLSSANTAREVVVGVINPAYQDLTVGQIVEVVITATAGTGALGSGIVTILQVDEDPV